MRTTSGAEPADAAERVAVPIVMVRAPLAARSDSRRPSAALIVRLTVHLAAD